MLRLGVGSWRNGASLLRYQPVNTGGAKHQWEVEYHLTLRALHGLDVRVRRDMGTVAAGREGVTSSRCAISALAPRQASLAGACCVKPAGTDRWNLGRSAVCGDGTAGRSTRRLIWKVDRRQQAQLSAHAETFLWRCASGEQTRLPRGCAHGLLGLAHPWSCLVRCASRRRRGGAIGPPHSPGPPTTARPGQKARSPSRLRPLLRRCAGTCDATPSPSPTAEKHKNILQPYPPLVCDTECNCAGHQLSRSRPSHYPSMEPSSSASKPSSDPAMEPSTPTRRVIPPTSNHPSEMMHNPITAHASSIVA